MTRSRLIAALALVLMLAGCAARAPQVPPSGAPIALTPATQGELASYLAKVKVTRPGAFAVSPDGRDSYYTWCDDTACATSNYSFPALRGCQAFSGAPCVVLYVRHEQRLTYTRAENAAPGGQHGSEQQRQLDFDINDRGGRN